MKRQTILLLLSVLLLSGGAAAQSTKEQTLEDLNRTAALYYCYENHPRAAATPAPEGYEPFYISHYGRHGSRWHASESVYENPRAKLRKAAEAGKLTPLGEEALRRIEVVADDARHRYGDLSPRGVREHRGIAERMYCSFPEIFSTADGRLCRIRARSTLVPRCMLSMAAANERLKELNPAIDITREASKRYLDYMFRMTEANKIKKEIKLRIAELRERLPEVPVLALTASATPAVARDIMRQLRFAEPHVLRSSFARPNLSYAVRHDEDKNEQLLRVVRNVAGSGIVYVRTRDGCEQLTEFLRDAGVAATCYHGGLANAERSIRQEEWLAGRTRIMVATNAFGMGIDKADVRFVVHYSMPDSLESYYQEAGRAGRDGKRAYAVLLVAPDDAERVQRRFDLQFPPLDEIRDIYEKVCSYLQIGIGDGEQASFVFNIHDFCAKFRLFGGKVASALKLLQQNG